MERNLKPFIHKDLPHKIVLITGPRQCGKTTLAKSISPIFAYHNYDAMSDRTVINKQSWDRQKTLIIFDELHKMSKWKRWLKGIYDAEGIPPQLLVTSSAKLSTFKKVGDSLAGRYFEFRLHPLDLKELMQFPKEDEQAAFDRLWRCSGFPEPCLKGSDIFYKRWRNTHLDIILRQDLIDLYTVHDLKAVENLTLLLKKRIGSTVSYANLARELEKDISTIKRWLVMLEDLYIIYRVTPYSKNITRSLLKEPKFYFYDHNQAEHSDGAKLENLVANALIKEIDFIRDTLGEHGSLHYLRTRDGKELDFLVCINETPALMIEVKTSDDDPAKNFIHFSRMLPTAKKLQLVKTLKREKTYPNGLEIRSLLPWLAKLVLL